MVTQFEKTLFYGQ